MMSLKTLIADDHPIFLEGLKCILKQKTFSFVEVVDTAVNGLQAYQKAKQHNPELLLIDMNMPEMDGPEVIKRLKKEGLNLRALVLSTYDQPKLVRTAFHAGADAYILKSKAPEELKKAILAIQNKETFCGSGVHLNENSGRKRYTRGIFDRSDRYVSQHLLTKRELEILTLITEAHSNKEIGQQLFISDQTVGVHRKNIMRKLGVTNTAGLIKAAHDHALI